MGIIETFVFSFKIMFENKVRSLLTMLGIIVGISSLILIVVIGNSFYDTFSDITSTLYKNNQAYFEIEPTDENPSVTYDEYGSVIVPEDIYFDLTTVNQFLENDFAGDSYVSSGNTIGDGDCQYEGKSVKFFVAEMGADELSFTSLSLSSGRDISMADQKTAASTAIIADVTANYLFPGESPLGKELIIQFDGYNIPVNVVGVFQYMAAIPESQMSSTPTILFINNAYLLKNYSNLMGDEYFHRQFVSVTMKNVDDMELFRSEAKKVLDSMLNSENWTSYVGFMSDDIQTIDILVNIILKIIFAIACIALFIGGVGVMNVMLVTVTERTNEIGVRKAMGATDGSIMFQFLMESFTITFFGTALGVVIGMILSKILAVIAAGMLQMSLQIPITINVDLPWDMIMLSVIISVLIGVVFGLYPAFRATKMQVVDALRYE